jgi:hypothetical protein
MAASRKALQPFSLIGGVIMSDFVQRLISHSNYASGIAYGVVAAMLSAVIYLGATWLGLLV